MLSLTATRTCAKDWDLQVLQTIFGSSFCFPVVFNTRTNMLISELAR